MKFIQILQTGLVHVLQKLKYKIKEFLKRKVLKKLLDFRDFNFASNGRLVRYKFKYAGSGADRGFC